MRILCILLIISMQSLAHAFEVCEVDTANDHDVLSQAELMLQDQFKGPFLRLNFDKSKVNRTDAKSLLILLKDNSRAYSLDLHLTLTDGSVDIKAQIDIEASKDLDRGDFNMSINSTSLNKKVCDNNGTCGKIKELFYSNDFNSGCLNL